jgi:hypothetical protein
VGPLHAPLISQLCCTVYIPARTQIHESQDDFCLRPGLLPSVSLEVSLLPQALSVQLRRCRYSNATRARQAASF